MRRLAPKVVEGLIAEGLCRLAVPASLGGHETEPAIALQIYEELAWADASVAWIVWINQFVDLASRIPQSRYAGNSSATPGGFSPVRSVHQERPLH